MCIYPARAGYDLQQELDFLSNRAMEANVFFTGRFLAPAMPRLEDRQIRLLLMRDEDRDRSRMRLLMPFSVEKPGFAVGLMNKDLGLALGAVDKQGVDAKLGKLAGEVYSSLNETDAAGKDFSVVYREIARNSGVEGA